MNKPTTGISLRLAILFGSLGAYALIAQTVLLRQFLTGVGGNELALAFFFGVWFVGIGVGAECGGRTGENKGGDGSLGGLVVVGAALAPLLLLAMKLAPGWLLEDGGVTDWRSAGAAALLVLPQGFWIGFAFPRVARHGAADAQVIGRLFVFEALGSALAGLVFSFVFALWVSPLGGALAGGALLIVGWGVAQWPSGRGRKAVAAGVTCLVLGVSPLGQAWEQRVEAARFKAQNTGSQFVGSLQTRYQNVAFAKAGDQTQLFGNGTYLDSFPDPYFYRQEAALLFAQHDSPRRVLLLGGGLTGLAADLLASPVIERLDVVELDARLSEAVLAYLPAAERARLDDPRLRILRGDERRYLRDTAARYDLAVVVAPDPGTALAGRLYTVECFRELAAHLGADGALVLSVTGASNYMGEEVGQYLAAVEKTLSSVFPSVLVLPGDTTYLVANQKPGSAAAEPARMKRRYADAFGGIPPLPPEIIDLFVVPERIAAARAALEDVDAALNTDLRPVAFLAYLRIWDQFSGGGLATMLRHVAQTGIGFWLALWLVVAVSVVAFPALGARGAAGARYGLASLATSGFGAMAMVIVVSLAYQSLVGLMYQMVALLFGVYMAGLGFGGWVATRALGRGVKPAWVLMIGDTSFVLTATILAFYLPLATGAGAAITQVVLFALLAWAGVGAGFAFPCAAEELARRRVSVGRRAGRVDAIDHLAALAGSWIAGLWMLPTVGLTAVLWVVAALKLASAVAGVIAVRRERPA